MKLQTVVFVLAVVSVIEGFRLATQSGLTGAAGSIQNDGYAVGGGLFILLGGIVIGMFIKRKLQK